MHVINKLFTDININYDPAALAAPEKILFLDIETTGFSANTSSLYLIGCVFWENNAFHCRQYFADKPEEEKDILEAFMKFASDFDLLIHFNGNNFDIPYMQDKCKRYAVKSTIADKAGLDIYRRIAPYKNFLKVPNCKQKTLEQYLGIDRQDIYSGGELINVYLEFVKEYNIDKLAKLLLHNENDLQGMVELLPILAYYDLFNKGIRVTKVNMDRFLNYNGKEELELVMKCQLPTKLPTTVTEMNLGCYFTGENDTGLLKVPVYEGQLKYFYANYKDYYYLPEEDQAMHKSVASFVDKDHRVQATAATCYTRLSGKFLRQYKLIASPFFKEDYSSKELYVELNDERKKDRQFFADYASHILNAMAGTL